MRPRSWCSWDTPNRSASRTTIDGRVRHVHPDLDRPWWRPGRRCRRRSKARITASFSSGGSRPCRTPSAQAGQRPLGQHRQHVDHGERRRAAAGAAPARRDRSRGRPESVLLVGLHRSAGTPRTPGVRRRPPHGRAATPGPARPASLPAAPPWWRSATDRRAVRRAWTSRGHRTPSSPRCAGSGSLSSPAGAAAARRSPRSASRCSTPKRCCSSTTTRPSSANSTCSWISACVPTTMPASPVTASSSAFFAPRPAANR